MSCQNKVQRQNVLMKGNKVNFDVRKKGENVKLRGNKVKVR